AARGQERDKHKTQTKHTLLLRRTLAGEETFHQHEEQRYEEHRQQGGRQGAADNPGADRSPRSGAR
ncbi:hypothetical protein CQA72_29145, partial [Klebsiella pneumoniae]